MIHIHIPKKSSTGGFMIGAILLTIVLIAAIVAAMTSGGSNSVNITDQENNRVLATSILSQAANIKSDIDLATSQGHTTFKLEETDGDCPLNAYCLYNTDTGYGTVPVVYETVGKSGLRWEWGLVRMELGSEELGSSAPESVIVLQGLKEGVCKQINSVLRGHDADTYNNQSDGSSTILDTGELSSTSGNIADNPAHVSRTFKAGCFEDEGAGGGDEDYDYSYVDVIDVK